MRTEHGGVLIDAGMKSDGTDALALIRAAELEPQKIEAVLLTHWHGDHAAGAREIRNQSQGRSRVVYHPGEAPFLQTDLREPTLRDQIAAHVPEWGPLVLLRGLLGNSALISVPADILAEDGAEPVPGFKAIATPGHTPGHLCYFYEPEGILFGGDALATVDGQIRPMARAVTPELEQAAASMKKALEVPFRHLCPGHRDPLRDVAESTRSAARDRYSDPRNWPLLG